MPHVRALFVENEEIMALLHKRKTAIREAVAKHTGYAIGEIALIPDMVSLELEDLAENLLPLEFTIDAGTKCAGAEGTIVALLRAELVQLGFEDVHFGIWLRTMVSNEFIESRPPL